MVDRFRWPGHLVSVQVISQDVGSAPDKLHRHDERNHHLSIAIEQLAPDSYFTDDRFVRCYPVSADLLHSR